MNDPNSELRAGILAELRRQQGPAPQAAPLAPNMKADDKPETLDSAAALYAETLLDKPGSLTLQERDWLRQSLKAYQDSQE
jgi:hypothetical protein